MVEVTTEQSSRAAPAVFGDLPDYQSPVSGLIVHGRKGRRDDLKRHGSRPYEGREQELKEAARRKAYEEKRSDERLHDVASRAYHSMSPQQRKILENR